MCHWYFGDFDLYRVNPPLVRMVAALPVLMSGTNIEWPSEAAYSEQRLEWRCARELVQASGERLFLCFTFARWACIPFSLLGALFCFRWASESYGVSAGLAASALWCFSPTILAHAQMITPDTGAAAFGVGAGYLFWRWLREPGWERAFATGLMLGLAQLTKFTWIILFGLWPFLWFVCRIGTSTGGRQGSWKRETVQVILMIAISVFVINLGYAFEGTGTRLSDFTFLSRSLRVSSHNDHRSANRFAGTWFGRIPVPLPSNYVRGVDRQKLDFERGYWSFLRGEWRHGGWWYYYLYALAIKEPLGTWVLVWLAVALGTLWRGYSAGWRGELVLVLPILAVVILVSSQTGFSHHLRYVLPAFPFAFIWVSKVARSLELGHRKVTAIAGAALVWAGGSSVYCYPHSLSYFNELVGGPRGGHNHLLNSNLDWGQDLIRLKRWLEEHPEARGLGVAYSLPPSLVDPADFGIECSVVPYGPARPGELSQCSADETGPLPGWYAIFVNELYGYEGYYDYFRHFEPVEILGYTVYVYCIAHDEANAVRRKLGIPEVTAVGPTITGSRVK